MKKYIIDANLPHYLGIWSTDEFVHVFELNKEWNDTEIWSYARQNNLTILSKDSDFSNRIMMSSPPPKVIHFRIGNFLIEELEQFLGENWKSIAELSDKNKLVKIYRTYIEANQ